MTLLITIDQHVDRLLRWLVWRLHFAKLFLIRFLSCLIMELSSLCVKYKSLCFMLANIACFFIGIRVALGHVPLAAITGTTNLVPYLWVKSLRLIWRSGTRRWYLRVPDLLMSCRDLTTWQGTRIVVETFGCQLPYPTDHNHNIIHAASALVDNNVSKCHDI